LTKEFEGVLNLVRSDFNDALLYTTPKPAYFHLVFKHKIEMNLLSSSKCNNSSVISNQILRCENSYIQYEKIYRLLAELLSLAEKAKLQFAVVKGTSLNYLIYGERCCRSFNDLDVLVRPDDCAAFNNLLNDNGFYQIMGPTASASLITRYSRAFLALNARNFGSLNYGALPIPIRDHQDKPQYIAYRRDNTPNIEMHDGLYNFSTIAIDRMLKEAVLIIDRNTKYLTLSPTNAFLLLLSNTYENSESFFSNTHDAGAVLRDYVDLRYFFSKYRNIVDWRIVDRLVDEYNIRVLAEIVMGNLMKVYGRDVTYGCLKSIIPAESEWGIDILIRMDDADLCRRTVLAKMRNKWHDQGALSPLIVSHTEKTDSKNNFIPWNDHEDVMFKIEYNKNSFILYWEISNELHNANNVMLYQFKFFPLDESVKYTSYKVDISSYSGEYKAYGHNTSRHRLGAIRKVTDVPLPVTTIKIDQMLILQTIISFKELGVAEQPKEQNLCILPEIYIQHYGEIYHRFDRATETIIRKIVVV